MFCNAFTALSLTQLAGPGGHAKQSLPEFLQWHKRIFARLLLLLGTGLLRRRCLSKHGRRSDQAVACWPLHCSGAV